jgi:Flp pilus assembly protein TadG
MNRTRTTQIASDFTSGFTEECGQEIAEAAIVLPILFLILLAIFWFGRAFNIVSTVERAARQGIRTATQRTCVLSCGDISSTDAQIATSVTSALQDDHLDPRNLTPSSPPFACTATPAPSCTTFQNVEICRGAPLTCGTSSCQSPPAGCGADAALGTRVSFGYRFTSSLPIASLNAMTITGSAQSEPEQ